MRELELQDTSRISRVPFDTSIHFLQTTRLLAEARKNQNCLKINLTFNGKLSKWENFRDLFKTLVHNIDQILPVKKIQYLKGCLIGLAAEIIAKIKLTIEG